METSVGTPLMSAGFVGMFPGSTIIPIMRIARPVSIGKQLLVHAIAGMVLGWAVLSGLLVMDVAGLASLVRHDDAAVMILAVLALQFGAGFRYSRRRDRGVYAAKKSEQPCPVIEKWSASREL